MSKFIVEGGVPLNGEVRVSGSKNAVLPLIAATLLTKEECILRDVPQISDVQTMVDIVESLGGHVEFSKNILKINSKNLNSFEVTGEGAKKMRASILFLSSLLARFGEAIAPYPGGCVIGKRPIDTHINAFQKLGAKVVNINGDIHLKAKKLVGTQIRLLEMSVTGAENAIIVSVLAQGTTEIRLAPCEPHVQDLCNMLNQMGAKISGVGTNILTITGVKELHGVDYTVTPDYLETGTYVIASLVTKGHLVIKNIVKDHLDIFWNYLDQMGAKFKLFSNEVEVLPSKSLKPIRRVRTSVYPDFPTDLLAPMAVLLTQAHGISRIFETMFEARLNYIVELEKMGVKTEILNNHEAIIVGPTKLKGTSVASWDLRAGTAMILAGLAATGKTEISNIFFIDRGYENVDEKLKKIGAKISREL